MCTLIYWIIVEKNKKEEDGSNIMTWNHEKKITLSLKCFNSHLKDVKYPVKLLLEIFQTSKAYRLLILEKQKEKIYLHQ